MLSLIRALRFNGGWGARWGLLAEGIHAPQGTFSSSNCKTNFLFDFLEVRIEEPGIDAMKFKVPT